MTIGASEDVRQDDGEGADDGAVEGEPDEFAFLHDAYHPLAGEAAADEGGEEADGEGEGRDAGHCLADAHLGHVLDVEECFAEYGGYDHEERELREALFLVAQQEACGYGAARAGEAGEDGEGLCDTDDEGVQRRDVLALARTSPVGEGQQGGGDQQTDAHDEEAAAEDGLHLVLEEEAHDGHRYHGDEDIDDVISFLESNPGFKDMKIKDIMKPSDTITLSANEFLTTGREYPVYRYTKSVKRTLDIEGVLKDTRAKLEVKFRSKPEVIDGNITSIQRAYDEVKNS